MELMPSLLSFMHNDQFDKIYAKNKNDLSDEIIKALETKIIPSKLNELSDCRVLDTRCVHSLEEVSEKVQQFIHDINPMSNKRLMIYHINEHDNVKYYNNPNLNDFKDRFKKIGYFCFLSKQYNLELTEDNTESMKTYYLFLQGPNLANYSCSKILNENPLVDYHFVITTQRNEKPSISFDSVVQSIHDNLSKKIPKKEKKSEDKIINETPLIEEKKLDVESIKNNTTPIIKQSNTFSSTCKMTSIFALFIIFGIGLQIMNFSNPK
jgi:hypothetical protein